MTEGSQEFGRSYIYLGTSVRDAVTRLSTGEAEGYSYSDSIDNLVNGSPERLAGIIAEADRVVSSDIITMQEPISHRPMSGNPSYYVVAYIAPNTYLGLHTRDIQSALKSLVIKYAIVASDVLY